MPNARTPLPKARAAVLVAAAALLAAAAGCAKKKVHRPGEHYDRANGFGIVPPVGWDVQHESLGTTVMFLSPVDGADDDFQENINVVAATHRSPLKLDAYTAGVLEAMRRDMTALTKLDASRVAINGVQAERVVCTYRMGVLTNQALLYFLVKGSRGYVLTCTAAAETYGRYEPIFEDACRSLVLD